MDPLVEQMRLEHARIAKFQKLWRSKRVFTNNMIGWKLSTSAITSMIVSFNLPTHFRAVFAETPKGFTEVAGYKKTFKKPVVRWVPGQGWIGDSSEVHKVVAKRGKQTVVLSDKKFEIMGVGNYEQALLTIVKNGWAPKLLLRAKPKYTKIDGIFYANKPFNLTDLAQELRSIKGATVSYTQEELKVGIPAVVLKLASPSWTYQFFRNGTVLFTGIKDPSEKDEPRKLFKKFFTEHGLAAVLAVNLAKSPALRKPTKSVNREAKKAQLAARYREATSWDMKPPHGFYVRPGTDGLPRLYKWRKMELERQTGEWVDRGEIKLTAKNATVVAKAFAKANQPIPAHTREVFANLGFPLENKRTSPMPHYLMNRQSPAASASVKAGPKNRRAPSWNAVKNGFYVRPGPGKQPYWYAVPAGIAAGRKTVIKTYTDAGRNIPAEVRKIFKIPANVKTNVSYKPGLQHVVKMGLNRILRINNRQATRLTKAELLGIARNMGIPEANDKMVPARLIALIKNKAGVTNKLNRTYDAYVNGIFYKLLNNKRVEKTTGQGVQTRRAWNTIPAAEQNKIAKKILPANFHTEYNSMPKANRFDALRAVLANKKPASSPPRRKSPTPARSPSVSSEGNNNFALELEYAARISQNLGNLYRNGNETAFLKIYKNLPKGARGAPLKAKVDAAYKKFLKNTSTARANEPARARYMARIVPPSWLPANKVSDYKKLLTNLAFQKPKPLVKNLKTAIKTWLQHAAPQSPNRIARNVENMTTGQIIHIPAKTHSPRKTPNIPKRTPPPVKSPGAKAAAKAARNAKAAAKVLKNKLNKSYVIPVTNNVENLGSAMIQAGLSTRNAHTWDSLRRAGVPAKFKNVWIKHVIG